VAQGDLVVTFYNPRSRGRDWQLPRAVELLREHRPAGTPSGSSPTPPVRRAGRLTTLEALDCAAVTMYACVVVGSSQSTVVAGRMVTSARLPVVGS
jgi:cobalt-precorrin 5A hydrolase/precorrin-3B C17-methyltransferase